MTKVVNLRDNFKSFFKFEITSCDFMKQCVGWGFVRKPSSVVLNLISLLKFKSRKDYVSTMETKARFKIYDCRLSEVSKLISIGMFMNRALTQPFFMRSPPSSPRVVFKSKKAFKILLKVPNYSSSRAMKFSNITRKPPPIIAEIMFKVTNEELFFKLDLINWLRFISIACCKIHERFFINFIERQGGKMSLEPTFEYHSRVGFISVAAVSSRAFWSFSHT